MERRSPLQLTERCSGEQDERERGEEGEEENGGPRDREDGKGSEEGSAKEGCLCDEERRRER